MLCNIVLNKLIKNLSMRSVKLCVWCQVMFVRPITYEILWWSELHKRERNAYYNDEGNS